MKFEVKNRFTGAVQFTAEIDCAEDTPVSIKLGLAVKWAVKTGADLADADLARAYLADAYLADADLADADLADADLADAENLPAGTERAARFRERNPDVPVIPDIDRAARALYERKPFHSAVHGLLSWDRARQLAGDFSQIRLWLNECYSNARVAIIDACDPEDDDLVADIGCEIAPSGDEEAAVELAFYIRQTLGQLRYMAYERTDTTPAASAKGSE